jgi:hypothetical protein
MKKLESNLQNKEMLVVEVEEVQMAKEVVNASNVERKVIGLGIVNQRSRKSSNP